MGTPPTRNASNLTCTTAPLESEDDDPGIRGLTSSHTAHNRSLTPNNTARAAASRLSLNLAGSAPRGVSTSHSLPAHPPKLSGNSSNHYENDYSSTIRDPLSAVGARQALGVTTASPALALDRFVLGHTGVDAHEAHGSVNKPNDHSAVSSLKDAFSSDAGFSEPHRHETNLDPTVAKIGQSDLQRNGPWKDYGMSLQSSAFMYSATPTLSPPNSDDSSTSSQDSQSSERPSRCNQRSTRSRANEPELIPVKQLIKQVCVSGLQSGRARDTKFCLGVPQLTEICRASREAFLSEPTLLRLDGPIKIVGDIHGQFKDLMRLFKRGGMPPDQHYLFLGDYVDRGKQSLETIVLLLLLKLRYPTRMHMLRGNHESAGITKVYGFYDECKRRSSLRAWRSFVDVFNCLPVAAVVGERIFCVHGGISPSLSSMRQIEAIQRPTDVPDQGILADLLWSDPDAQVKEWSENDRGVSFCFGQRSLDRFCRQLDVDLVVRGHMVVETGYEFFGNRRLVTVFSAPNYCGDFDNCAAVMHVSDTLLCSFDVIEPRTVRRPTEKSGSPQATPTQHELSQSRKNDIGVS